jgi:hypothetical protein
MGLSVSRGIDFSGGVESGGLESNGTFINYIIQRCIAQILVPDEFRFGLLSVGGWMDKEHVGRGIGLVVFQASRTIIGGIFFGG